jgi:hypothetical protein
MAAPIPRDAPVTIAILFSSWVMVFSLFCALLRG